MKRYNVRPGTIASPIASYTFFSRCRWSGAARIGNARGGGASGLEEIGMIKRSGTRKENNGSAPGFEANLKAMGCGDRE
jgi:hypothetical protein